LRCTFSAAVALGLSVSLSLSVSVGCAKRTDPATLFELAPESPAIKAMQNRRFETSDSDELLSASAAVLQDLGFQISESTRDVGFLRAAKERSARERGQEITRWVAFFLSLPLTILSRGNAIVIMPVDLHQQINASLIAQPLDEEETEYEVRVVFYRLVWKSDGQVGDSYTPPGTQRMEMIRDPEIYQQFFSRLHKSVFLETQKI
jgi:hypothetical protein